MEIVLYLHFYGFKAPSFWCAQRGEKDFI